MKAKLVLVYEKYSFTNFKETIFLTFCGLAPGYDNIFIYTGFYGKLGLGSLSSWSFSRQKLYQIHPGYFPEKQ